MKVSHSQKTVENQTTNQPAPSAPISLTTPVSLNDKQRLNWLRLYRTRSIGSALFKQVINYFGSSSAAVDHIEEFARSRGRSKPLKLTSLAEAETELENITKFGAKLVAKGEAGYPPLIAQINLPPPLLTIKGDLELADKPIISAVGSRNASALGISFTQEIISKLAMEGFTICSGLARGIDYAAHLASLQTGTIAVIAGGIDHIYPKQHEKLYHQIAQRGLLITDRPFGHIAKRNDFPRRNRLISGASLAVIIFEAAKKSGSLITARLAAEQSRQVFTVPGHPKDPRAAGTNELIKQGASPLTHLDDILLSLASSSLSHRQENTPELPIDHVEDIAQKPLNKPEQISDDHLRDIMNQLSPTPISIDELSRQTGIANHMMQSAILELCLMEKITLTEGQMVCKKTNEIE